MTQTTAHQRYLQRVREEFERNTAEHKLTVLMDQSTDPDNPQPYRHLRIAGPGTRMYSWDIITWPGHLATAGDIADGHTFARIHDMVDFFHPGPEPYRINPGYWAEKLAHSQRAGAEALDSELMVEALDDYVTGATDGGSLADWPEDDVLRLRQDLRYDFEMETIGTEESVYQFLHQWQFEVTDDQKLLEVTDGQDPFAGSSYNHAKRYFSFTETDLSELIELGRAHRWHLLLAMHAIVRGLELYREQLA